MTKKEKRKALHEYDAAGTMMEAGQAKKFTRSFQAYNEAHAKEILYALLGSGHRVKRRHIVIERLSGGEGS